MGKRKILKFKEVGKKKKKKKKREKYPRQNFILAIETHS